MAKLHAVKGDITQILVEAVVNNGTPTLHGGGGVESAIHAVAGEGLMEEVLELKGCRTGEAKITMGYNLPAKYIIHTVGPIYGRENGLEEKLLTNCYHNSLRVAKDHDIKTIAFPAIATGIYGYPMEDAARVAIQTVKSFFELHDCFEEVIFVLFHDEDLKVYKKELEKQGIGEKAE